MQKKNLTFIQVVYAVVLGQMIFQWINELHSELSSGTKYLLWACFILYLIIGGIFDLWKERQEVRRMAKYVYD